MAQAEIEDRFNNSFTQKFGFPKTRAANKVCLLYTSPSPRD